MVLGPRHKGIQAAAALAELRGVLFGEASREDDAAGFDR